MRRVPSVGDTRIVLLGEPSSIARIRRAARNAADFFLTKPFSPRELLTTVHRAIEIDQESSGRPAQSAGLRSFESMRRRGNARLAAAFRAAEAIDLIGQSTEPAEMKRALAEVQQIRAVDDFRAVYEETLSLAEQLDRAYCETLVALARAIEARDPYTGQHLERVRSYSRLIAERLGVGGETLRMLDFGAALHDVGKIGIPDAVLTKPGPLGRAEWAIMQRHPQIGRELLSGVSFLAPALDAVAHHHERWDGRGYPEGLACERIPLIGRIVSVADAFDAMTTSRPYRDALSFEHACDELQRNRGSSFDPDVVDAFLASPPRAA